MPDGNHLSPDAPITVYVDGDIKALPFIADLKRAGLRLVQEDGKTFLRKQEERDEPEEAERDTIDRQQQVINREHASLVRTFLASVRPIKGVCFCDNEAMHTGRGFIERIALYVEGEGEPLRAVECVDTLFFLSNIVPLDEERCYAHSGQSEAIGYNLVLDHIADVVSAYVEKHEKND